MKICSRRHRRHGRHSHEGAAEDRRRRGRVDRQPHRRERARRSPTNGRFRFTRPISRPCIDRPGVDAVILTTPSEQHADQTRARARRKASTSRSKFRWRSTCPTPSACWRPAKKAGKSLHGHAHAPLLAAAPRDQAPDPGRHVPPASHGGRDLLLPPDQPQHARPAAIVGRQPAVAPRLPLGRHRAVAGRRSELGGLGPEGTGSPGAAASRWTSPSR